MTDDGRRTTDDGRRTTDDGRRTTDDGMPPQSSAVTKRPEKSVVSVPA
jgi:hypothetical protein